MSSRLNDLATRAKVIMMQRRNERDLCGHVLERNGYVHLRLPSENELETHCRTKIGFEDPRRQPGELLFPALFPSEVIEHSPVCFAFYATHLHERRAFRTQIVLNRVALHSCGQRFLNTSTG